MGKEIRQMIDKVKNFKQFVNEQLENDRDRTKIKSQLFFVSNIYKDNEGKLKYVELKPYKHNSVEKIFIFANSVVFYTHYASGSEPIDELNNINMDSNTELANMIEDRLNNIV